MIERRNFSDTLKSWLLLHSSIWLQVDMSVWIATENYKTVWLNRERTVDAARQPEIHYVLPFDSQD